jgi:hypothetical protein
MPGVFPDYPARIVRNDSGKREMVTLRWGMPQPPRTSVRPSPTSTPPVHIGEPGERRRTAFFLCRSTASTEVDGDIPFVYAKHEETASEIEGEFALHIFNHRIQDTGA